LAVKGDFYEGKLRPDARRGALVVGHFPFQVIGFGIFTQCVEAVFGLLVPPRGAHSEAVRWLPGQLRLRFPRFYSVAFALKLLRPLLVRAKVKFCLETDGLRHIPAGLHKLSLLPPALKSSRLHQLVLVVGHAKLQVVFRVGPVEKQRVVHRGAGAHQRRVRHVQLEGVPSADAIELPHFPGDLQAALRGKPAQKLLPTCRIEPHRFWLQPQALVESHVVGSNKIVGKNRHPHGIGHVLERGDFHLIELHLAVAVAVGPLVGALAGWHLQVGKFQFSLLPRTNFVARDALCQATQQVQ
jgi:hypothetical protein